MNKCFNKAGLIQHSDKTFIGRITKGVDWQGYQYGRYPYKKWGIIDIARHVKKSVKQNVKSKLTSFTSKHVAGFVNTTNPATSG